MGFKENLLNKIKINELASRVVASLQGPDSGVTFDREAMRQLLQFAPYTHLKERDLDLYVLDEKQDVPEVLVLDNGLAIYHTDIHDVVLRKSPTVKEMISIRNAVKILSDSDVRVSKRADSVKTVHRRCLADLDLSFQVSDIKDLEIDGAASLESGYVDGVVEGLSLFAELLDYRPAPRSLRVSHVKMWGSLAEKEGGNLFYGPVVLFSLMDNRLSMVEEPVAVADENAAERLRQIARGKSSADRDGAAVFRFLGQAVLETKGADSAEKSESDLH